MKTIFKDKNIKKLKNFLILSDGTCVVEYTKFDDKQKYVLIDDKEFGPFEKTDLFLGLPSLQKSSVKNYYFAAKDFDGRVKCFCKEKELTELSKKNQNIDFDETSENEKNYFDEAFKSESEIDFAALYEELSAGTIDWVDPYIKQKGKFSYFEINNQSFGPFSLILVYAVKDEEHFQLTYVSPFEDDKLHYILNGEHITSVQLRKKVNEIDTTFLPYFSFQNCIGYNSTGEAVFSNLPEACIYIDGKRVDYFNGKCSDIVYFEKYGHFLAIGHLIQDPLSSWYCYDGEIHKNWHNARFLDNGKLVYLKTIKNKKTGSEEVIWYLGKKRISVPINAAGTENLIEFGGSLIYYLRDKTRYILMNGKEYQGFRVNYRNVALLTGDEIKLYQHKDEFENELELAEYLEKNNLLAGAGDLPVTR